MVPGHVLGTDSKPASTESVGDFSWDPWTVKDVLIPSFAGRGLVKKYHQRRTLYQYLTMSLAGLWAFYNLENNGYRAFALGLLFPGAGHTAVATFPSLLAFIATVALFPVTIFIWFAMGGIFFPLALYLGSAVAAGFMLMSNASSLNATSYTKAQERNNEAPGPEDRELSLETLRHAQHMLERGLSPHDNLLSPPLGHHAVKQDLHNVDLCLASTVNPSCLDELLHMVEASDDTPLSC
ncbi:hypothetical protein Sste5346_002809 [Sporothrix stenoceras]|uniref:Uncharacterized protein n=1 Tax=Sporothrix stenoceras TaxID=5173 RepID=A0ABR3ZHW3_9PEZI